MPEFRAHKYRKLRGNVEECIRCGSRRKPLGAKNGVYKLYGRPRKPIDDHPTRRQTWSWSIKRPRCRTSKAQVSMDLRSRFESGFTVEHCGVAARLMGNFSLREAGARNTTLGYECAVCFIKFALVDEHPRPSAAVLTVLDETP